MKFLIIQPCWDHSEVLAGLLYYIKKNNHQLKIIYDWSHPEGNYLDYYCELMGFGDDIKFNYKSPKFHVKEFQRSDKIIFVDEIHLRKFMNKTVYKEMEKKILTFNHITKKIPYKEIKVLTLGNVPFKFCSHDSKYLTNCFYNPGKITINKKLFDKKKFLVVGKPSERQLDYLEKLININNWEIILVVRGEYNNTHKNVTIMRDLSTKDLIELFKKVHFVLTLFKKNSIYHRDRISGITTFAISFGIPMIMDNDFAVKSGLKYFRDLTYKNNYEDFLNKFNNALKLDYNEYMKLHSEILEFRNHKITEQYLNFDLIFKK